MNRLTRTGRLNTGLVVVLVLLALACGVGWFLWPKQNQGSAGDGGIASGHQPQDGATEISQATLQMAIAAVASAEDGDYGRSMQLWEQLLAIVPGDASLQLNQAVTALKWIEETNNRLNSGRVSDPAEQDKLRSEVDVATLKADQVVAALASLKTADYRATLLQAALLESKARKLQYPADQVLRRQAADVLVSALSKNPGQPLLACKLDELAQELGDENFDQKDADSLFAAWKAQPRNLFLLVRAGETLLRLQDPRIVDLLQPSIDVAKPMMEMLGAVVQRLEPEKLVAEVRQSVAAGDWRGAQKLRQWLNVLKGTSGFRPDTRLVIPDILALIDTGFLNRFSSSAEQVVTPEGQLPQYRVEKIANDVSSFAWYDFDLDLDFDLVTLNGSTLSLFPQNQDGHWESSPAQTIELSFAPSGMLVADLFEVDAPNRPRAASSVAELMQSAPDGGSPTADQAALTIVANRHDTLQELVVWGPAGMAMVGLRPNESPAGLVLYAIEGGLGLDNISVQYATVLDIESDGDLDLFVVATDGIHVLQNNGNRTFEDISVYSHLENPSMGAIDLVACDYDSDLDQDILAVAHDASEILLFENILHGQFRLRKLTDAQWPKLQASTQLVVADVDGNSSWDWLVASGQGIDLTTTSTLQPGEVVARANRNWTDAAQGLQVGDLNNDSHLDFVASGDHGIAAYLGGSDDWSKRQQLGASIGAARNMQLIDCNRDGWLDLAAVVDNELLVMVAQPNPKYQYLSARVRGINDGNGGGRINHFAVGSVVEVWSGGKLHRQVIRDPVTHFGLGQRKPDNLRIVFTNGLTQNLESPEANQLVEERQELKGSCPFLYGWNGERFELITDLLWNAPLGLQIARGTVLADRRWEYLMLPGEMVQPREGGYELRITEELFEVAYFDHIQLTAVDHPIGTDVFTNEKVGPPSISEHRLFQVEHRVHPKSAIDSHGRNVLDRMLLQDRVYAQAFDHLICQGLAEPHFIELNFGKLATNQDLHLFLNGWMHPTDTSLNISISQNSQRNAPEPPSLWVVDANGQWVCAQPFMGFPGGKPKSIVIDLSNVFQSEDHRLRIGSSQQIYWDEAFVAVDTEARQVKQQELHIDSATLGYRGFSQLLPRATDQPHWYDYSNVSLEPKWPELEGPFTRFGDVRNQLIKDDDLMVVMTAGDEIVLRFSMAEQEVPIGWRRDFVLHSTGWDKDADMNTLAGQGSLPLPFRDQTAYPPSPQQSNQSDQVFKANADTLSRVRQVQPVVNSRLRTN